jgi:hypothetical protein
MLETLTPESFTPHLNSRFRIALGERGTLDVELCELALHEAHPGARPQPFSLYFRGPRQAVLPQQIYRLEHDQLGALEIFLVTVGPDAQGMRYEAVFN